MTDALALAGAATGISGLALAVRNSNRDRASVSLEIAFDMAPQGTQRWMTTVTVKNLGRRSVHVSHVGLCGTWVGRFGRLSKPNILATMSIAGLTLAEGSGPWHLAIEQDANLLAFLRRGTHVRAFANAASKVIYSAPVLVPTDLKKFSDA